MSGIFDKDKQTDIRTYYQTLFEIVMEMLNRFTTFVLVLTVRRGLCLFSTLFLFVVNSNFFVVPYPCRFNNVTGKLLTFFFKEESLVVKMDDAGWDCRLVPERIYFSGPTEMFITSVTTIVLIVTPKFLPYTLLENKCTL